MRKLLVLFVIVGICMGMVQCLYAQTTVHLKSGKTVEGEVIERTNNYIKLKFSGVTLTYWMDEIDKVVFDDGEVLQPEGVQTPAEVSEDLSMEAAAEEAADEVSEEVVEEPAEEVIEDVSPDLEGFAAEEQPLEEALEAAEEEPELVEEEPLEEALEAAEEEPLEVVEEESAFVEEEPEIVDQGLEREQDAMIPSSQPASDAPVFSFDEESEEEFTPPELFGSGADFPDEAAVQGAIGMMAAFVLIFLMIFYVYAAVCLMMIAEKTGTDNGWFAWIPIMNIILMCDIAGKPRWWVLLFFLAFIPILGPLTVTVISVILWMKIAEARGKPAWLGVLMIFLPAALFVMGYLAFSKAQPFGPVPDTSADEALEENRRLREEALKVKEKEEGLKKFPESEDIVYRPRETKDEGRRTRDEKKEKEEPPVPPPPAPPMDTPQEKKDQGPAPTQENRGMDQEIRDISSDDTTDADKEEKDNQGERPDQTGPAI